MQKRFSTASGISEALKAAREGDFSSLLGSDAENWWAFARERIDIGADELMLRLTLEDDTFGPWYLWLLFSVQEQGATLAFEGVAT